jgi:hypothetical protein
MNGEVTVVSTASLAVSPGALQKRCIGRIDGRGGASGPSLLTAWRASVSVAAIEVAEIIGR